MHSLEEQERFDERETMSDDVDELRRAVQGLRDEIRELTTENITLRESANDQAHLPPGGGGGAQNKGSK
jgi:regulator of replication initiation timing